MKKDTVEKLNKKRSRRASGISWRLFGTLVLLLVITLLIIWIFQVLMLNSFYEKSKLDEFARTENEIYGYIENESKMIDSVYKRSVSTGTCIELYRVDSGIAQELASSDVNGGCMLHHMTGDGLSQIYSEAVSNGGVHSKKIQDPSSDKPPLNAIYVSVRKNASGAEYVLMMDSELVPMDATVKMLQMQYGWIACLLIIVALIVALAISRVICAPLEKMSRSARRLAKGDYKAEFINGGYREAAELGEALSFAASELAKTDDLQKELLANVSHDLRTPLTMIRGYGEVIRDIPGENNPENVQVIIDETERLTELVNDMLDLSKIRAGTRKPNLETFDLTETVKSVLSRYEKLTERDNYTITFAADENVMVTADRTMILQVVYNLVNNALNYTGEDKRVSIDQSVWDNRVRISVIDTGGGIAKEDIPYIWDRYYKVDKVHKRAKVGTGLGLSIVKGILESHGAAYGVESREGCGSNFWFELETFRDVDESEMQIKEKK